jgi:hypothetical protein
MKFERTTGVISALLAAAILGAVVTAQPSRISTRDRLASLESDLRFQLELRWRQNRRVYNSRVAALESVLKDWQKSPRSEDDAKLMVQWLRDSILQSIPGESGELPPTPGFGQKPAQAIVAAATREKDPAGGGSKETGIRSQKPELRALGAQPANPHAAAPQMRTHRAVTMPAQNPPTKQRPPRVLARSTVERGTPRTTSPSSNARSLPPAPVATAASGKQKAEPFRMVDSVAPDEQSVTVQKIPAGDAKTLSANSQSSAPSPATKPVELNLAELNARIGGYHDGLDELDAAIVAANGAVSEKEAILWVERLEELAGQYAFVLLYYDALTAEERDFVVAPRSMASTITLVAQQCEGIDEAESGDFLDSSDDESPSEFAKRLDAVAAAVSGEPAAKTESR